VTNVAFVWCYEPSSPADFDVPDRWYPGDGYVDWFAIDVFKRAQFTSANTLKFLAMADAHGKPVYVSECSAMEADIGGAKWGDWFGPFFDFLKAHPQIEGFNYIATNWAAIPSYAKTGWHNADVTSNAELWGRYCAQISKPQYLHAGEIGELAP
jgi:beta-mannanase